MFFIRLHNFFFLSPLFYFSKIITHILDYRRLNCYYYYLLNIIINLLWKHNTLLFFLFFLDLHLILHPIYQNLYLQKILEYLFILIYLHTILFILFKFIIYSDYNNLLIDQKYMMKIENLNFLKIKSILQTFINTTILYAKI